MFASVKWFSGLFIVGTVLFSACQSTESTPSDSLSLGLHQSGRLGSDVTVRVDSIQDSRCPMEANCIWAGQARVKLMVSTATDSSAVRVALGADPGPSTNKRPDSTGVTLSNAVYKVILREVTPYPSTSSTGQPKTAVVQVTKL